MQRQPRAPEKRSRAARPPSSADVSKVALDAKTSERDPGPEASDVLVVIVARDGAIPRIELDPGFPAQPPPHLVGQGEAVQRAPVPALARHKPIRPVEFRQGQLRLQ